MIQQATASRSTPTPASNGSESPTHETNAQTRLAIAAAMKRASEGIVAGVDKGERLEPGTMGVDVTVRIEGDIVAGNPKPPGAPKTVPAASPEDLLASVLCQIGELEAKRLIASAISEVRDAKQDEVKAGKLKAHRGQADAMILEASRRRKFTTTKQFRGSAGAITGKPGVTVSGSVAGRLIVINAEG